MNAPEHKFSHFGVVAETREQWEAREAQAQRAREQSAQPIVPAPLPAARVQTPITTPPPAPTQTLDDEPLVVPGRSRAKTIAALVGSSVVVGVTIAALFSGETPPPQVASVNATPPPPVAHQPTPQADVKPPAPSSTRPRADDPPPYPPYPRPMDSAQPGTLGLIGTGRISGTATQWADEPTIDPARRGWWWCTCYERTSGAPQTACRRTRSQCETLVETIQTGKSRTIRKDSVRRPGCVPVRARFPWQKLGHREAWSSSAFSDAPKGSGRAARERRRATQAKGVCAL